MLVSIQNEEVPLEEIKYACEVLDGALDDAMDIMARLSDSYIANKDRLNMEKIDKEVEKIEAEYSEAQNRVQVTYDWISSHHVVKKIWEENHDKSQASNTGKSVEKTATLQSSSGAEGMASNVPQHVEKSPVEDPMYPLTEVGSYRKIEPGQDMWKQLKRVTIPTFSGNKKTYQNWKAVFTACVDQAPVTAEYKLLQLCQCLTGDALRAIQNLGHSTIAYEAAKDRLE